MAKNTKKEYSAEEISAARRKLAAEHGVDDDLATLVTGQSPEEIEAQMKLVGALTKRIPAAPTEEDRDDDKPKDEDQTTEGGKFDPVIFDQMLDKLIGRFGEEQVQRHLAKRLGVDTLNKKMADWELRTARAELAAKHKLTPEQAAEIPGSTPEELRRNMEWAAKQTEGAAQDQRAAGAQSGGSARIPMRTIAGGGAREPKTVEEAEAAFDGVPPAFDTRQR